MSRIEWDKVGERKFQAGVDRGVLYPPVGSGVPWNGLVSVTENIKVESKPFYMDGMKYREHHVPNDFSASLKAFTYPEELDALQGISPDGTGIFFHDQGFSPFGLSYRTKLGDDQHVDVDLGYRIHILYNVFAVPDSADFTSLNNSVTPLTFGWSLTAVPAIPTVGRRITSHISIDSTSMDPELLAEFEDILYGTVSTAPRLPTPAELGGVFEEPVVITYNGDGTWTATGPDDRISVASGVGTILDANTIDNGDGTYTISSDL